jgi:hypothetical protein
MAKDSERIRRDQAGVGPDPSYRGELVRLDDLHDFKVADGEPTSAAGKFAHSRAPRSVKSMICWSIRGAPKS